MSGACFTLIWSDLVSGLTQWTRWLIQSVRWHSHLFLARLLLGLRRIRRSIRWFRWSKTGRCSRPKYKRAFNGSVTAATAAFQSGAPLEQWWLNLHWPLGSPSKSKYFYCYCHWFVSIPFLLFGFTGSDSGVAHRNLAEMRLYEPKRLSTIA